MSFRSWLLGFSKTGLSELHDNFGDQKRHSRCDPYRCLLHFLNNLSVCNKRTLISFVELSVSMMCNCQSKDCAHSSRLIGVSISLLHNNSSEILRPYAPLSC